jgi:hypothetical protein
MSIAGTPNTQNLSHEQFGGLVDGIQNITSNFQERYGYHPPEQEGEDGTEGTPETRRTAFQPNAYYGARQP